MDVTTLEILIICFVIQPLSIAINTKLYKNTKRETHQENGKVVQCIIKHYSIAPSLNVLDYISSIICICDGFQWNATNTNTMLPIHYKFCKEVHYTLVVVCGCRKKVNHVVLLRRPPNPSTRQRSNYVVLVGRLSSCCFSSCGAF